MTETLPLRIHSFDEVTSTNDIAAQMARDGEPEGTVVSARTQTSGRGRRGRIWLDRPGENVLMSMILTPPFAFERLPELSFVASLSVAECLRSACGLRAALKWPNDVFIGDRKIAGILLEIVHTATGHAAVIGIGVNANQRDFPPELNDVATSVVRETGCEQDVPGLTHAIAESLAQSYGAYLADGFEDILTRWRKYMWGVGRQADVALGDSAVSGIMAGIDDAGALVIVDNSGNTRTFHAADSVSVRL